MKKPCKNNVDSLKNNIIDNQKVITTNMNIQIRELSLKNKLKKRGIRK